MSDPMPEQEEDDMFLDELYNESPIGMDDTPDAEGMDDEVIGATEEDSGFNWSDPENDNDNEYNPDDGLTSD